MAKLPAGEAVAVQLRLSPAGNRWQQTGAAVIARGIPDPTSTIGRTKNHPHARIIESKISQMGLSAAIRIVAVAASELRAKELLHTVGGTFGVYTLGEGNNLAVSEPAFWQKKNWSMRSQPELLTSGPSFRC